jgi:hypothetical protein
MIRAGSTVDVLFLRHSDEKHIGAKPEFARPTPF